MQLKVNDQLPIAIQAADEFGNPTAAVFDAPPAWSSSDVSVAAVVAAADGLSAVVASVAGKLASATIQVSGLVGGKPVVGAIQLDMIPGDAAEIVLAPGVPVAVPLPVAPPVEAAPAPVEPVAPPAV